MEEAGESEESTWSRELHRAGVYMVASTWSYVGDVADTFSLLLLLSPGRAVPVVLNLCRSLSSPTGLPSLAEIQLLPGVKYDCHLSGCS